MSSTRQTNDPENFAQERYMSAPQFTELRPLSGNLVAEKAQLYDTARHREMLYFLHAVSLRPGGLKALSRRIIAEFPGNVGSPLARHLTNAGLRVDCESLALRSLPRFLAEICLDPEIDLERLEETGASEKADYLRDVWAILKHFKNEADKGASAPRVVTSIGEKINATLEHALATRRMVVIEGEAGTGKSHSAEDWSRMHTGQARFISLSGITHRTGLFQKIAACIGLAAGGRKAAELQARIEDFFAKSKLMLVVDEAHYLWPQTRRCSGPPEFVNWINTALVNQGVPVALICTDQFVRLKGNVEKQTGWTSEQLMHRIKRYTKLPPRPTEADLRNVAELLLSMEWSGEAESWKPGKNKVGGPALKLVVGYALASRLPMATVRDLVDEARAQSRAAFRSVVTFEDMELAWREYQVPSDVAMKSAFPTATERPAIRRKSRAYVVGTTEATGIDVLASERPGERLPAVSLRESVRIPTGARPTNLPHLAH